MNYDQYHELRCIADALHVIVEGLINGGLDTLEYIDIGNGLSVIYKALVSFYDTVEVTDVL